MTEEFWYTVHESYHVALEINNYHNAIASTVQNIFGG